MRLISLSAIIEAQWLRLFKMNKQNLLKHSLLKNAVYLTGFDAITAIGGMLFWLIAARLYTIEQIGLARSILSAVGLVSTIASFGLGTSLIRFLPEAREPNDMLNSVISINFISNAFVAIIFLAGGRIWSPILVEFLNDNIFYLFAFVVFAAFFTVATTSRMAFLAWRRSEYSLISALIVNVSRILLLVLLVSRSAVGITGALAISVTLGVIVSLTIFLPRAAPKFQSRWFVSAKQLRHLIAYSLSTYIGSLFDQGVPLLLPLIILETIGAEATGYFAIAWLISGMLASPGLALVSSSFAEGSNAPSRIDKIVLQAAIPGLLFTCLISFGVGLSAPLVLRFFGSSYAVNATILLRWLALTSPFLLITRFYFMRLRVQKQMRELVFLSAVLSGTILLFAILLIPHMELEAMGVAWFLGHLLSSLYILRRAIHNSTIRQSIERITA